MNNVTQRSNFVHDSSQSNLQNNNHLQTRTVSANINLKNKIHVNHLNIANIKAKNSPTEAQNTTVMNNSESKVYGLSPPEILGGIAQVGSIYNRLFLDEDFIKLNKKSLNSVLDEL